MKKILVTGASGFLGRHILPLLKNYEVLALSRIPREGFHSLDLLDFRKVDQWMDTYKPDILLHLAWEMTPGIVWHAKENLAWLKSSLHLFEAFYRNRGEQIVSCGTCYETLNATLYGATKESLRLTATQFFKKEKIPFAWGRVFYTFGPFEKKERLIPSLISSLIDEKTFQCRSATHLRDFTFIEDVARAFSLLLEKKAEGCFEIGTGEGHSIAEVASLLENFLGKKNLIQHHSEPATPDNPEKLVANPSSLQKKTGWKPNHTLAQSIEKTINWWQHALCH